MLIYCFHVDGSSVSGRRQWAVKVVGEAQIKLVWV